jgi:SAM-dependent methyltransferase
MAGIKHSAVLTREEHREVQLHREFRKRLPPPGGSRPVQVLDWGCGRGSDVLHLRQEGYDAYGVEPDAQTIERGEPLFAESGLDQSQFVRLLEPGNRTRFDSESFDFLMSYQVLEHVEELESAAREMFRVLRPGGTAVHLYPAHHCPIEGHVKMPLVHWLPKNAARRAAIATWVRLGVHARWPQLAEAGVAARTDTYYSYTVRATHYRPPRTVLEIFRSQGFEAAFESHRHERVRRHPIARHVPAPLLGWLLTNFAACVLICRKPSAAISA